jgi:hypothetical protein
MRYLRTYSGRSAADDEQPVRSVETPRKNRFNLPSFPKPTITGLMSFVRHGDRSRHGESTEMSTYMDLESVNAEYSQYLKKTSSGQN